MIRFDMTDVRGELSTSPPPWDRLIGISATLRAVDSQGREHVEEDFPIVELCHDMCGWLRAHDMSIVGYAFVSVEADCVLLSCSPEEDGVRLRFGHDQDRALFHTSEVAATAAVSSLIATTAVSVRAELDIDVDDLLCVEVPGAAQLEVREG